MSNTPPHLDYLNWIGPRRYINQVAITSEEWVDWWKETGCWLQRGSSPDDYCMKRIETSLPFSLDNIVCIQNKDKGKYWNRRT